MLVEFLLLIWYNVSMRLRMKKHGIELLKGIVVGIGNIAPGLSGGVMAVILNVYDRLINGIKDIYKHPIKIIKDMWGLLLGIAIGILIGFIGIVRLIEAFPIPMMMLFIGFIIGPIPNLYAKVKPEKKTWVDYLVFFVMVALIVGLSLIKNDSGSYQYAGPIALFFIGVVVAATMIIPGISGTAILMVIGVFTYLVNNINGLIDAGLAFNFSSIFDYIILLLPLGLGFIIGAVILAKGVSKLFAKYTKTMNCAVIGLLISCPFSIISTMLTDYREQMQQNLVINIIIGVITLIIGAVISIYLSGIEKKNEQMQDK